jgi:purine-nucleoside phosphorylase
MTEFAAFERLVLEIRPRTAIVLGSGLGAVIDGFRESGSIAFPQIPGLYPASVLGHLGRLRVGLWNRVPLLLFAGRLHVYEGHSLGVVAEPTHIAANLGTRALILTNAAGGINPMLSPGSLMAIREHIKIIGSNAWRDLIANSTRPSSPYSTRLLEVMQEHETRAGRQLPAGTYAALTGPSYETPAEIRALAASSADAVGMSTALEAETASRLGLEVAGISCVTNAAAGLGSGLLNHAEVLDNAKLGTQRLGVILESVVRAIG